MTKVNFCKRHMLGQARSFLAFSRERRRGGDAAAEQARLPGQHETKACRRRHNADSRQTFPGFHEPMSEFCSQHHAPMPRISDFRTKDKSFRPLVIRSATEMAAFPLTKTTMKPSFGPLMVSQGPRQAKDYAT
jgi:hypothetical protein